MNFKLKKCGFIPKSGKLILSIELEDTPKNLQDLPKEIQQAILKELYCVSWKDLEARIKTWAS